MLINSKGMFIYDTLLKRGRAFVGKNVIDLNLKKHRKMCKSIVLKGEWGPSLGTPIDAGPDMEKFERMMRRKEKKSGRRKKDPKNRD